MAKTKTAYFCQNCGYQSPKWMGKCSSCNEWNTFNEEVVEKKSSTIPSFTGANKKNEVIALKDITTSDENRIQISDNELSRVMGGGIVLGSVTLFGGEPGIGKSTLMLQLAMQNKNIKTLYISGEESLQQIKLRANRIGEIHDNCLILTETKTTNFLPQAVELQPELIIIDSIQTLQSTHIESPAGSVSQIRQCSAEIIEYAKTHQVPVFLIGHITKEGSLAGPKVLEHMVDTVIQFEGDRHHLYRLLRSSKNRFGSTHELGIYEMGVTGLNQVDNPSEVFVSNHSNELSGRAIAISMEGVRPMLIEVQALVSTAVYGTPQRSTTGFDSKRLNMLLAVLEKRCGFKLGNKDVFINIAGGLKVDDPAIDLAVICAVLSSNADIAINPEVCFSAEVSLNGEIRPINRIEHRIQEAAKLGFKKVIISQFNKGKIKKNLGIEIIKSEKIEQIFQYLFA